MTTFDALTAKADGCRTSTSTYFRTRMDDDSDLVLGMLALAVAALLLVAGELYLVTRPEPPQTRPPAPPVVTSSAETIFCHVDFGA
ncbi:hypothetical protein [Bradyrhizobium sp. F1.13.3]|uniref:hypothetical protein n=1 Tax=Bradyrhizobium sp. F1.13.3 TaxID=3156351 RepID=UPI00339146CD